MKLHDLNGWGFYPRVKGVISKPYSDKEIIQIYRNQNSIIPRGKGRSYGDASLNQFVISNLGRNRILHFDLDRQLLHCESGITVSKILEVIVPMGYFLPIVPGTKSITIGGAIASDIHGKNHHQDGSFANFLQSFEIILPNGNLVYCSRTENHSIFWNTIGSMGLTGVIIRASIKLAPIETAYITSEAIRTENLEETIQIVENSLSYKYVTAWLDLSAKPSGIGRSVLYRGNHTSKHLLPEQLNFDSLKTHVQNSKGFPLRLPFNLVTPQLIRQFNRIYYKSRPEQRIRAVHYNRFFFPLDRINQWNKLYGNRGFIQIQAVFPLANARHALLEICQILTKFKETSALTVLKRFSQGNMNSPLSFPKEGYCISLDIRRSLNFERLAYEIHTVVDSNDGRIYLAKDATMSKDFFHRSYPRLHEFKEFATTIDKNNLMQSEMSRRLHIK